MCDFSIVKNYKHYANQKGYMLTPYSKYYNSIDTVGLLWITPVVTLFCGTITTVTQSEQYGNIVEYQSLDGHLKVQYCHLNDVCVKVGQRVEQYQIVGYEGDSGSLAKEKHLHLTLWVDGIKTKPLFN